MIIPRPCHIPLYNSTLPVMGMWHGRGMIISLTDVGCAEYDLHCSTCYHLSSVNNFPLQLYQVTLINSGLLIFSFPGCSPNSP